VCIVGGLLGGRFVARVGLRRSLVFLAVCLAIVWWFFKTGYRLKN